MRVSIIIPTLNEADNIKRLLSEMPMSVLNEIIFVDGNSTDGTPCIIKKTGHNLIMQEGRGFGSALIQGIKKATGDVIVIMDVDGSHNPKDIPKLIDKLKQGNYDCVFASRYTKESYSKDDTPLRMFGNWLITKLVNILFKMNISDSLFLFTIFKKSAYDKLKMESPGFEFCIEIITKAHVFGLKIGEIPSIEYKRMSGETKVNDFIHGYKLIKSVFDWRLKLNKFIKNDKK